MNHVSLLMSNGEMQQVITYSELQKIILIWNESCLIAHEHWHYERRLFPAGMTLMSTSGGVERA